MPAFLLILVLCLLACASGPDETPSTATSAPDAVELRVEYGSEKKAWMEASVTAFEATGPQLASGRAIDVVTHAQGSGEGMQDILAGRARPHVYSPASSAYLELLNDAWLREAGRTAAIVGKAEPLVLSPVVIAMWKPMAEALGWPGRPVGWADLLKVSAAGQGWSAHGHPEWGDFKLGHTHPGLSNSGLLAVLAEVYAGAGKLRGLTPEDLVAAEPFVRQVEASLVHYGKSTNFLFEKMVERGPSYISAAVLYEHQVVEAGSRSPELPLVAVYPVEGTFWCDHPYAVVEADWVGAEEKEAAKLLGDYLRGPQAQAQALAFGFRPSDPSIAITAPIDTAHGVDATQPQTLLDVPDGKTLAAVLDLWHRTKKTSEVVLVFDKSGSMKGEPLTRAKEGARVFLENLDDRDAVSLAFFDTKPATPGEFTVLGGGGRLALQDRVGGTVASGGTALYDAVHTAYTFQQQRVAESPGSIHAVVVMTHGRHESSRLALEDLVATLGRQQEAPVKVFTIAYGDGADPTVLARIADAGRGSTAAGGTGDIVSVFRDMAAFF